MIAGRRLFEQVTSPVDWPVNGVGTLRDDSNRTFRAKVAR